MSDEFAYLRAVDENANGGSAHACRLEYPRGGRYVAVCACGTYRSKSYFYPGLAQNAGDNHVKARGGA